MYILHDYLFILTIAQSIFFHNYFQILKSFMIVFTDDWSSSIKTQTFYVINIYMNERYKWKHFARLCHSQYQPAWYSILCRIFYWKVKMQICLQFLNNLYLLNHLGKKTLKCNLFYQIIFYCKPSSWFIFVM